MTDPESSAPYSLPRIAAAAPALTWCALQRV